MSQTSNHSVHKLNKGRINPTRKTERAAEEKLYNILNKEVGLSTIDITAPATGPQLHGDDYRDILGAILFEPEYTVKTVVDTYASGRFLSKVAQSPALFMDPVAKTTCAINHFSLGHRNARGHQVLNSNPRVLAPPCFDLSNKFKVGDEVIVLADMQLMYYLAEKCGEDVEESSSHLGGAYHSLLLLNPAVGNATVIQDSIVSDVAWASYLCVVDTTFTVTDIIKSEQPDAPYNWDNYRITCNSKGSTKDVGAVVPAGFLCRKLDLVPYI